MKTLLSQCLKKMKRRSFSEASVRTQADDMIESPDVSLAEFHMVRTITEARESPDRMLCSRRFK